MDNLAPASLGRLRIQYEARVEEQLAGLPLFQSDYDPTIGEPPQTVAEFNERASEYFQRCFLADERPRINGLTLELGFPGPATMMRHAMRHPEFRIPLSRCLTRLADQYEKDLFDGSATAAMFMLKHIPEYDPLEQSTAPPIQYWRDKQELHVSAHVDVPGIKKLEDIGKELSPREAYYKLVRNEEPIEDVEVIEEEQKPSPGLTAYQMIFQGDDEVQI